MSTPADRGEVLATDLAETGRVAKILALTDDGSGNLHLDIHLLLGNTHRTLSPLVSVE